MRAILLTIFLATAAFAQWERHVGTAKGEWVDTPSPDLLSFFTASGCVSRAPEGRSRDPICDTYKTRTELKLVEHVGRFSVYDLNYFPFNPDQGAAKSILVESAANTFHEIYFREQTQSDAVIQATQLLTVDGQRIVLARYDFGGIYGIFEEDYFSFSNNGTKLMHPGRIKDAAQKQVPENSGISPLSSNYQLRRSDMEVLCGRGGSLEPSRARFDRKHHCPFQNRGRRFRPQFRRVRSVPRALSAGRPQLD